MTTLLDLQRIFSVRGIDPDQLSQDPAGPDDPHRGDGAFVLTSRGRRVVRFGPVEHDGQRTGWAYSAHDPRGVLLESGHTDSTVPESLLPVLRRHLSEIRPAATQSQLDTVTALADPGEHRPTELHPDSPTGRWILGLFVAWRQLERGGSISGADAICVVDEAFAAIGLTDDITVDELAVRTGAAGAPRPVAEHPAVRLVQGHLDRAQGQGSADAHGDLARELVEALRLDNQLVTYRRRPTHARYGPDRFVDNEDRAGWAEAALDAVCARTGEARACYRDPDALTQVGSDLVANLLHLADRAGLDPELILIDGMDRHREESQVDHDPRSCSIPGCTRCAPAPPSETG